MTDRGSASRPRTETRRVPSSNDSVGSSQDLLQSLQAICAGDFSVRMRDDYPGIEGAIAAAFNEIAASNERMAQQLAGVGRVAGRDGQSGQRVNLGLARGAWADMESSVNTIVDQLNAFASEVTRVAGEVDHRAKNALALAQSIVRLTRAQTMNAYVRAVEGRITALARVHTVLSLSSWQGAEIRRLVAEEIAPCLRAEQIQIEGAEVQLQPATAQTLALALHELVTNSAKYGSLSTLSGRLAITWEVHDETLILAWVETGGPAVTKPIEMGFGTRSVVASIETQLGGRADFDWRAEGLICRLTVPLRLAASDAQPFREMPTQQRQSALGSRTG